MYSSNPHYGLALINYKNIIDGTSDPDYITILSISNILQW